MSPFSVKDWRNALTYAGGGDTSTPLSATAIEDMERRLSDYTDAQVETTLGPFGQFVIHDDFSLKPNGAFTTTDSGHTYELAQHPTGSAAAFQVVSGKATSTDVSPAPTAAYAHIQLPSANLVGAEWTFGDESTINSGAIGLMMWVDPFHPDYASINTPAPDNPVHFVITPSGWAYGIAESGVIDTLGADSFATPLVKDDTTRYRAVAFIDDDTATILLPDGSVHTFVDARIATQTAFAESNGGLRPGIEIFATDANAGAKGAFTKWWADNAETQSRPGEMSALVRASQIVDKYAASGSTVASSYWVEGDDVPRISVRPDSISFGPGDAPLDAVLYRAAPADVFLFSSVQFSATAFYSGGLTAQTQQGARFVGGTTSGPPTTGTWNQGDYVVDHTGRFWVCSIGGTPGTWLAIGSGLTTTASTATMPAPTTPLVVVTGTANITAITPSLAGRSVTYKFGATAATTGVVDGSNLKLSANFAYTADDTLTLICDGTDWYETARSVN